MAKTLRSVIIFVTILWVLGMGTAVAAAQPTGDLQVLLTPGENTAEVNGEPMGLDAPAVIKDGHTLVPLRFVGEALEASVDWNSEDKSVRVESGDRQVFLWIGKTVAAVNDTEIELAVGPQIIRERTMVPLRFVSEALEAEVGFVPTTKLISIIRKMPDRAPIADFTFENEVITPGDTPVIIDRSHHPLELPIVDQEWTGKAERYEPGLHEITLRVRDERGSWSEPVTHTLRVKEPPTAAFRTEKSTYRIGEPIVYINESSDPDDGPLTLEWTAEPAYFTPGEKEIHLTVKDEYGLAATATETIIVTDRVYYTKEEYYLLYGEDEAAVPYEEAVLEFPVLEPEATEGERTLLRINSPEEIREEGILYRDTASGPVRIMVHHLNRMTEPINIHALAHNPSSTPAVVRITRQGIGGPAGDILRLGRLHLSQFFAPQSGQTITIPAGGTVNLLSALQKARMKPNDCFTGMWDLEVSAPLEFTFAALKAERDPLEHMEKHMDGLPHLAADGRHIRGTFPGVDRIFKITSVPDDERARIILADRELDPPSEGIDALTGERVHNIGNYGVVYRLDFDPLPGETALVLNPRGGNFCGAVKVGSKVVEAPANGYIRPQVHAVILHKNKRSDRVTLELSPPSGSFLPVNILSVPMPAPKGESGPLIPDK